MTLSKESCIPCRGGVPPLKDKELEALRAQVPEWTVVNEHHITRNFIFSDFKQALDFVNRVGEIAEHQGHHPDILLAWGKAEITMWTHKIDGLTHSDFFMAAKFFDDHAPAGDIKVTQQGAKINRRLAIQRCIASFGFLSRPDNGTPPVTVP